MATVEVTTGDDLDVAMGVIGSFRRRSAGAGRPGRRSGQPPNASPGSSTRGGSMPGSKSFRGYSTFAAPFSIILALAARPGARAALPAGWRGCCSAAGAASGWSPKDRCSGHRSRRRCRAAEPERRRAIEPSGARSSGRSAWWRTWIRRAAVSSSIPGWSADVALDRRHQSAGPRRRPRSSRSRPDSRLARRSLVAIRAGLLAGLGLLAEREVRGVDVPGANDNASGCGVVSPSQLAWRQIRSARPGSWC